MSLSTRRQPLHTAAGHALETLHHESLTEHYEELAYHFTQGEVWDKAFDYLLKSGDKARQAYANQEAAALYGKAKATIEQMATAIEDEALRSTFLQSAPVQEIHEHAARLGG